METKASKLWKLFITFFKISPITFGGGYAMISLIEREVVKKHKWISNNEIANVLTVAQTAPGAIAINSAIFIGYRVAGLTGTVIALLGMLLPTIAIVIIATLFYSFFRGNAGVEAAFHGIGAAVIALIIHAGFTIGRTAILDITTMMIAIVSFLVLILFNINPILVILGGGAVGIVLHKVNLKGKERASVHQSRKMKVYDKDE